MIPLVLGLLGAKPFVVVALQLKKLCKVRLAVELAFKRGLLLLLSDVIKVDGRMHG
jgi:hypothetical protein